MTSWIQDGLGKRYGTVTLRQLNATLTTGPFGTALSASEYVEGGVPLVNPTHILNGWIEPDPTVSVRPETALRLARHRLAMSDLVVGRHGDVGRSAIVGERETGWLCGSGSIAIRLSSQKMLPGFLQWFLESRVARDQLIAASNGATMDTINESSLRDLAVPLPSYLDQVAITSFLARETVRIDSLINAKRQIIDTLEERLASMRASLVLQGLDPTTGLGCTKVDWTIAALGVVIALHRGFDLPDEDRGDGDIPVISSGGISGKHSHSACDPPGVVTGRYGTIGEVFYSDVPYWPLNTTLFVSEFRGNDPRWVYHLLATIPLDVDSAKSAVTGINRNVVGRLRVPKPPGMEQRAIAARVDESAETISRALDASRRQVELLKEHRQALITSAVIGDIEPLGIAS